MHTLLGISVKNRKRFYIKCYSAEMNTNSHLSFQDFPHVTLVFQSSALFSRDTFNTDDVFFLFYGLHFKTDVFSDYFFYDFFHVIYCTIDLRVCQSLFRLISKLNSLDAHPTNPFVIRVYLSEESVGYCHISQSFLLFLHAHTHTHSVFLGFWFSVTLLTSLILWKNNHCYLKRG